MTPGRLKVLHVIRDLHASSGGPSRSVPGLCRSLAAAGLEVTLCALHRDGELLSIHPEHEPYRVKLLRHSAGGLVTAFRRFPGDEVGRFDLMHIQGLWNPLSTLAAAAARRAGVPYVLAPRGMLHSYCIRRHRLRKRFYCWLFDRRTIENAARLHFLNGAEAEGSHSKWFRLPERFVCPNGVDLEGGRVERGGFRRRYPELAGRLIILFLGRLHPLKNLDLQLEGVARLVAKYPSLMWLLVGPDDGEWARLDARIRAAGLADHARWLGALYGPERCAALADADVVLQTSFYECHSMTISEALAVGVPLVVTRSVNFDEVGSCGAGRVVEGNADAVAAAIDEMLHNREAAEDMRNAGRRYAAEQLAWSRVASRLVSVYQEILEWRRPVA